MDNQALQQIKGIIDQHEQISIAVGRHARLDDMAAALGLYLTFQTAGKKVAIAAGTEPLVEHSSLVGIDKVATKLSGSTGGDFVVSFPYKDEGEIEKVSYTLDNGLLNIIVKPGEQGLSFSEQDVKYTHGGSVSGLLITVGAPRLSDLANVYNPETAQNLTIINIDNKEQNENFGQVVLVSPRFSSISEQVADLLLSLGYDFDVDTAQNLLLGITAATNNFQAQQTSYLAFEIAAILLRKGAKRQQAPRNNQQQQGQQNQQRQGQNQQRGGGEQHKDEQQPRGQQQGQQNQQRQGQNQQRFEQRRQDQSGQRQGGQVAQRTEQPHVPQQNQQPVRQPQQVQVPPAQPAAPQPLQTTIAQPEDATPPADWLTPKVYKGSTNI